MEQRESIDADEVVSRHEQNFRREVGIGVVWERDKTGLSDDQTACVIHGVCGFHPGTRTCAMCIRTGVVSLDQATGEAARKAAASGVENALEIEARLRSERDAAWESAIDAYAPKIPEGRKHDDPEFADAMAQWNSARELYRRELSAVSANREAAEQLARAGAISQARTLRNSMRADTMPDPRALLAATIGSPRHAHRHDADGGGLDPDRGAPVGPSGPA